MVDYSYYDRSWTQNIDSLNNASKMNYAFTPMVGYQPSWINSVWPTYTPSYYMGGTSGSSTSTIPNFETADQYNERIMEETRARQKEAQNRAQNGSIEIVNNEIKLDDKTRTEMKEEELKILKKTNNEVNSLGMSLAMGAGFTALTSSSVRNCYKTATNRKMTNLFFKPENVALFEKVPIVTTNAQKELSYIHRQYLKQLHSYQKAGRSTASLTKAYNGIVKQMENALASGNADEVAKVTSRITQTDKLFRKPNLVNRYRAMAGVDVSKVTATKGNSFLSNLGGKSGIRMGLTMASATLLLDSGKIIDAFKKDTGEGFTQLGQSAAKSLIPASAYILGDGIGKWIANTAVSKCAGKVATGIVRNTATRLGSWFTKQAGKKLIGSMCAKIGTKLAGRAIGTAIGSIIPGAGTILGFVIGTAIDWAVREWVLPDSDISDKNRIYAQSDKQLLKNAIKNAAEGKEINSRAKNLLTNNPGLCQALQQEIVQEQQVA